MLFLRISVSVVSVHSNSPSCKASVVISCIVLVLEGSDVHRPNAFALYTATVGLSELYYEGFFFIEKDI